MTSVWHLNLAIQNVYFTCRQINTFIIITISEALTRSAENCILFNSQQLTDSYSKRKEVHNSSFASFLLKH